MLEGKYVLIKVYLIKMKSYDKKIYQFKSQTSISSFASKNTKSTLNSSNLLVESATYEIKQMVFIKEKKDALQCPIFEEKVFNYNKLVFAPKLTYKNNILDIELLSLDD